MVEGDGADGVEAAEIVLERVVGSMPGYDVEGSVCLCGGEEVPVEFAEDGVPRAGAVVLGESSNGALKVAGVRQAVTTDRPELGEGEVALVELEDVPSHGPVRQGDLVSDSAGNYADLVWADENAAQLGTDVEKAVLEYDEEVAIGAVECFIRIHGLAGGEDENAKTLLHCRVAGARDES